MSDKRRRAFLVEDQPDVRDALTGLLHVEGYEVLGTAATEFQATLWGMEHEGEWEVIVDLLLAEHGSGFSVVRRFASAQSAGHIAVFSGYITDVIREKCLQLGADAVIEKGDVAKLARYLRMIPGGSTSA